MLEKEEPYNGPDILVVGGNKPLELTSGTKIYKENAEEHGISGLRIEGNIDSVFKYMAKNTNVEWGMSYEGSGKNSAVSCEQTTFEIKLSFSPSLDTDITFIHIQKGQASLAKMTKT